MAIKYSAPRGTHDLWGREAAKLNLLEKIARNVLRCYGYSEVRMPIFEEAALFTRSIGEATDIVEKEMYVFKDRKERCLALRPEGTAGAARLYVEHALGQYDALNKYFYCGSMFRYERPQAGRYREFFQIGAEHFGNPEPSADAEMILLARDILDAAGLGGGAGVAGMKIHLHTIGCAECRPAFRQALLAYINDRKEQLCEDCARRATTNPLRVLDCKIDGPRMSDHPKMESYLCPECAAHFLAVQKLLAAAGCDYIVDAKLVRGLDYYTRTIFEIRPGASTALSASSQDALAAGGRYDNLVAEIGGQATPAVGFALGSERVMLASKTLDAKLDESIGNIIFVAVANAALEAEAFKFASQLRCAGDSVPSAPLGTGSLSVQGPYAAKSLKSQMKLADKISASTVIIFGEEEFARGTVIVRDMKTQQQKEMTPADFLEKAKQ
jgi:histidyl-tRNA synthetase